MKYLFNVVVSLFFVSNFFSSHIYASEIKISSAENVPYLHTRYQLIEKAYEKIGLKVSLHLMPVERSLYEANRGFYDAELFRVKGIEKLYPNLIRVPVKIFDYYFHALYLKNSDIGQPAGVENNRGSKAGYLRGIKFLENRLANTGAISIGSQRSLVEMLLSRHIDIAFVPEDTARKIQDSYSIVAQPVAHASLYHYIHSKHEDKLEALTAALKEVLSAQEVNDVSIEAIKGAENDF